MRDVFISDNFSLQAEPVNEHTHTNTHAHASKRYTAGCYCFFASINILLNLKVTQVFTEQRAGCMSLCRVFNTTSGMIPPIVLPHSVGRNNSAVITPLLNPEIQERQKSQLTIRSTKLYSLQSLSLSLSLSLSPPPPLPLG